MNAVLRDAAFAEVDRLRMGLLRVRVAMKPTVRLYYSKFEPKAEVRS